MLWATPAVARTVVLAELAGLARFVAERES